MLKVFIVDDESIIREGLRDNIPWQQFGYEFVGEASDGEMALPMIRKLLPDVLITDIKMPFMDGLALSRIVSQEFPKMRIIIISGYDEFEYAQQAIKVGVEQYLLKPVTKNNLQKVLSDIKDKIEAEEEQRTYIEKFQNDMQEYAQYSRRLFFEKLFEGQYSTEQIYDEASKLSIDLNGSCYNLVLLGIHEKKGYNIEKIEEELLRYFMRFPEYLMISWSINTYLFIVKGEKEEILSLMERCVEGIKNICQEYEEQIDWHVAVSEEVGRLSLLPDCYLKVNRLFAHRFLTPTQNVFTKDDISDTQNTASSGSLSQVDASKVDPEIIKGFLAEGDIDEINDFISGYLAGFKETLTQKMFRNYLLLNIRFSVLSYVESLGETQQEFLQDIENAEMSEKIADIEAYMRELFKKAISIRDRESDNISKHILKRALEYIEENYCQETLSLNTVSTEVGVSSNYFSGIFSQEMKQTFIEYVTEKRMKKAMQMLKQTDLHSGEIAAAVGYKDAHYFSFVFKKTLGCTPREYRNSK